MAKTTDGRMTTEDTPAGVDQVLAGLTAGMHVAPDEVVEARYRDDRANDALKVLDRLPRALRPQKVIDRLARVCPAQIVKAAKAWEPRAGNMLLLGETGLGKSTAAAFVFRRMLGRGVSRGGEAWQFARRMHWFHAVELMDARVEHPRGKGMPPEIESACAASLLVIDDVGQDRFPDAVAEVVSARYDDGLPTILTSNLGFPEGLVGHYGQAIARKMIEAGGIDATIVDLTKQKRAGAA